MSGAGSYSIEAARELSPRMVDVLRAAARGSGIDQTARELGIAAGTVRTIRQAAFARLGVGNITAAVTEARRRGAQL
jgi:DNA-binding NarL/FixJ family response regulator